MTHEKFNMNDLMSVQLSTNLKPIDKTIISVLYAISTEHEQIYPSMETLCKYVNCSRPTLTKSLNKLKDLGYIDFISREVTYKYGASNQYFLTGNQVENEEDFDDYPQFVKKFYKPIISTSTKQDLNPWGNRETKYINPLFIKTKYTPVCKETLLNTLYLSIGHYIYYIKLDNNKINLKQNENNQNIKKGSKEMRSRKLFEGAPSTISKKYMTDKQLLEEAMNNKIKLNYTEAINVYRYAHRKYLAAPRGEFTATMMEDMLSVLQEIGVPKEKTWEVLVDTFKKVQESATVRYISPYMIIQGKDIQDLIKHALDANKPPLYDFDEPVTPDKPYYDFDAPRPNTDNEEIF